MIDQVQTTLYPGGTINNGFAYAWALERMAQPGEIASAQRVLASIQAVDRYERSHHSNVHRGSHTLSAEATAASRTSRARPLPTG